MYLQLGSNAENSLGIAIGNGKAKETMEDKKNHLDNFTTFFEKTHSCSSKKIFQALKNSYENKS